MSHKRRRSEMETDIGMGLGLELSGIHGISPQVIGFRQSQQQQEQQQQPLLSHHHHLPENSRDSKQSRLGNESSPNLPHITPSFVGQPGMPPPAAKPNGPKLKFTTEDDALLIDLKESKRLTWKSIAEFFPGRSSGTLQVRYCTKLKAKTMLWTDESIQKLRSAVHDYEIEKWRIIANKVGTGFSPAACKEKVEEMSGEVFLEVENASEDVEEEDDEEEEKIEANLEGEEEEENI